MCRTLQGRSMETPKQHFVVVPLMAQGHMIPMADFSLFLAGRGARVSLITTPVNARYLRGVADISADSGLPLRLVELPFPCAELGLPVGCENVDLVPRHDLFPTFYEALNLLAAPLKRYLRSDAQGATCIIADLCMPWAIDVAGELGIPRFVFQPPSCFFLLCTFKLTQHKFYDRVDNEQEAFPAPGLPESIGGFEVSKLTAQRFFDFPGLDEVRRHVEQGEADADGLVLNTFEELESCCLDEYRRAVGKEVWPVGPVSAFHKNLGGKAARGCNGDYNSGVVDWLQEKEKPGSVIFVSFGTFSLTQLGQLVEIGRGLEASGRPFLWALKRSDESEEGKNWLSEFEERTKERGKVIRGWAPQAVILTHPAVGGFMTHCGWNSTLEAVAAGMVMATWPHLVDQFLNERLVVDVLGIGVRVGVKWPSCHLWEEEGEVVGMEEVREAVERVMDGGKDGEGRRRRARELADKASKATEEGGSSFEHLNRLMKHAMELART